jgi:enoyl-CoA hydratase/carnithine racemase
VNLSSDAGLTQSRHDEIARLEGEIEQLAERIERCRRIIFAAKIAIALGGALLLALVIGIVPFNPTAMIVAMTAIIGGIVALGSNTSTAKQAAAEMGAAQAQRDAVIGRMHLRVIH